MIHADTHVGRTEAPEDDTARARRMAVEALEETSDSWGALDQWRDEIETDPALVIAVIGRQVWEQRARDFFTKCKLSPHARQMRQAQIVNAETYRDRAYEKPEPTAEARKTAIRCELGILGTVTIGDKALAFCTKAEVVAEQRRSASRATFLAAIAELLPTDDAVVKDFVTPKRAKKLSAVEE